MWRLIDLLRSQEGDSVTILCDNPEPCTEAENNAVICNGDWTDWEDRRFSGVSLLDALSAAMIEYKRPKEPTSGAQRTDGGVEADMPSNETATDVMAHPSPMGSRSCDENTIACGVAGVAPGPSGHAAGDTTPRPLPGREEIARIIDPIGMSATERSVVVRLLPEEVQRARIALEKADAILSTIAPEAIRADERERCAKVAENFDHKTIWSDDEDLSNMAYVAAGETCDAIAAAIRAGGAK